MSDYDNDTYEYGYDNGYESGYASGRDSQEWYIDDLRDELYKAEDNYEQAQVEIARLNCVIADIQRTSWLINRMRVTWDELNEIFDPITRKND